MTMNPTQSSLRRAGAFTLVEVMISVALALFLIVGVNQVFKMTSDTVSAGQVMSANVRDSRAAQSVLFNDLNGAVTLQPPAFIIAASRVSAFRNAADQAADRDYPGAAAGAPRDLAIRTLDFDADEAEGEPTVIGEVTSPATYNHRSHRIDRLAFFSRDIHQRQTAMDGSFYTTIGNSTEAWVWYGHLNLANNDTAPTHFRPGQPDLTSPSLIRNHNNLFASSFTVGRVATLLKDPGGTPPGIPAGEARYARGAVYPAPNTASPLTPLAYGSAATITGELNFTSRYDLAGITIAQFLEDVRADATANPNVWFQRLLYGGAYANPITAPYPGFRDFRFEANRLFTKPLDSEKASKLVPILLTGCSQFIVEFAGDYISQNNDPAVAAYGNLVANLPDGIIDFVVDQQASTTTPTPPGIRWYGMPRDVAGATAGGPDGQINIPAAPRLPVDVVPLRDVRGGFSPFERAVNAEMPLPASRNYADLNDGMIADARYTCVWGPDLPPPPPGTPDPNATPQMLRVTFVLDDASGRIAEGQSYEFVIDLP